MADTYKSRYTAAQIEAALTIINSIAERSGIPCGTGEGSVMQMPLERNGVTAGLERIPTSAAVANAIAASRRVSQVMVLRGRVETAAQLPPNAQVGDTYIVTKANDDCYTWDGQSWTDTGRLVEPVTLASTVTDYQIGDSGQDVPTGNWSQSPPETRQGAWLWTRVRVQFSVGEEFAFYSAAYIGVDGKQVTVCGVEADAAGNIALTAGDVGAVPAAGGAMTGNLTVPAPVEAGHAVNKGYVDTITVTATLTAAGWVGSGPYTQTITVAALTDGRRCRVYPAYGDDTADNLAMQEACGCLSYTKRDGRNVTFTCLEEKPEVDIGVIVEVYV